MASTTHEELLIFTVKKKEKTTRNYQHDHSESRINKKVLSPEEHVHDELRKKREDATDGKVLLLHENIHAYETVVLEGNATKSLCQNGFCCDFDVNVTTMDPSTKYRLAVFNNVRRYTVIDAAVIACGVIQCSNDSIASCGSVQDSGTTFSNIDITATFRDYKNLLIMPSTLKSNLRPMIIEHGMYSEHFHDNHVHITLSLNDNATNLVTFGIYARNFNKNVINRSASFDIINYFIVTLMSLLLLKF